MKLLGAAVMLACGCLMTPPIRFGAGKSPEEAQHDMLGKQMPPQLTAETEWPGAIRTEKIRVLADDDFRAQNVHWEQTFGEELEYANSVLAPLVGIRLVAEYRAWDRHAPGATLDEDLAALAEEDAGQGVLTVVGLTSALSLASATFDQLGLASLPGNHLMIRGYANGIERAVYERAFPKLPPEERDAVLEARRRHKTAAILLHELGHNFGAPHDPEDDTLMNAMYSDHSASFSAGARTMMVATLDMRLGRRPAPAPASEAPHATEHHPQLVISLDAAGAATIGGREVDAASVDDLLRMSFANDHDTEIVIRTERTTPSKAVIELFDRAKAAGLKRLSLAQ